MKRTGTVYLTIRKKLQGGWGGDAFTIVRASTRRRRSGSEIHKRLPSMRGGRLHYPECP